MIFKIFIVLLKNGDCFHRNWRWKRPSKFTSSPSPLLPLQNCSACIFSRTTSKLILKCSTFLGLCSLCTDLEIAGDVHCYLFFTRLSLHSFCSCIPFSGTGTSYLVILKSFFSLLSFLKRICAVGQGYSDRYKQPKQYHLSSYLLSNPGVSCSGEYEKLKQKLQGICWISKQKHIIPLLITAKHTLIKILFCYNFSAINFLFKVLYTIL